MHVWGTQGENPLKGDEGEGEDEDEAVAELSSAKMEL